MKEPRWMEQKTERSLNAQDGRTAASTANEPNLDLAYFLPRFTSRDNYPSSGMEIFNRDRRTFVYPASTREAEKSISEFHVVMLGASLASTEGSRYTVSEPKRIPDPRFADLAKEVFSQAEKEELLSEILHHAIVAVNKGDTEPLRRALLAWEYTALWKKNPTACEQSLEPSEEEDGGVDWREFLSSEGI